MRVTTSFSAVVLNEKNSTIKTRQFTHWNGEKTATNAPPSRMKYVQVKII